jgi:hypothetical protein
MMAKETGIWNLLCQTLHHKDDKVICLCEKTGSGKHSKYTQTYNVVIESMFRFTFFQQHTKYTSFNPTVDSTYTNI